MGYVKTRSLPSIIAGCSVGALCKQNILSHLPTLFLARVELIVLESQTSSEDTVPRTASPTVPSSPFSPRSSSAGRPFPAPSGSESPCPLLSASCHSLGCSLLVTPFVRTCEVTEIRPVKATGVHDQIKCYILCSFSAGHKRGLALVWDSFCVIVHRVLVSFVTSLQHKSIPMRLLPPYLYMTAIKIQLNTVSSLVRPFVSILFRPRIFF